MTAEAVDQMVLPEEVALAIKSNVAVIATLSEQIDLLEKRLQEKVAFMAVGCYNDSDIEDLAAYFSRQSPDSRPSQSAP